MKLFNSILFFILSITIAACGGDPNSAKLEIRAELGELDEFINLENQDVVMKLDNGIEEGETYVILSTTIPFIVKTPIASNHKFQWTGEVLDKYLNKIAIVPEDFEIESKTDFSNVDFSNILHKGKLRAVSEMRIPKEKWDKSEEAQLLWDKIRKEGKYLVIKNAYSDAKYSAYGNPTSEMEEVIDTSTENNTVSSSDWDALLDEYEIYVNKLVDIYKKVQSGDMNAMTEYASLLESAENLNRKLENAKNDMNPAQVARLNKIVSKMSQSMM